MQVVKDVRDLKIGDVLVGPGPSEEMRSVVVHNIRRTGDSDIWDIVTAFYRAGKYQALEKIEVGEARRIVVLPDDAPSQLTPAQLVADQLAAVAFEYEGALSDILAGDCNKSQFNAAKKCMDTLHELLKPLRPTPPIPATYDELAEALRNLFDVTHDYDAAKSAHSAARALFARLPK